MSDRHPPPLEIAKSDLSLKSPNQIFPQIGEYNSPLKLLSSVYPLKLPTNLIYPPPPNRQVQCTPQIAKNSDLPSIKLASTIPPPPKKIAKSDLLLKSPQNLIYLQIREYIVVGNFEHIFPTPTSCFASQRSFLRKTN